MTKDEPGFGWYKRACCESTCGECGIDPRFTKTTLQNDNVAGAGLLGILAADVHSPCDCEFRCLNDSGVEIDVVVKVKMYTEQVRSGGFQKEMEEVEMTLSEFKEHFVKCAHKSV